MVHPEQQQQQHPQQLVPGGSAPQLPLQLQLRQQQQLLLLLLLVFQRHPPAPPMHGVRTLLPRRSLSAVQVSPLQPHTQLQPQHCSKRFELLL